jgi:hypothetical protein
MVVGDGKWTEVSTDPVLVEVLKLSSPFSQVESQVSGRSKVCSATVKMMQ